MADGIKWREWGEDLERDCREMRKLESWGIYPHGWHDERCGLHEDDTP